MTFNERYYDASVRHQIDLLRFGNGVSRKVNGILDATLGDLRKQVERRLGKTTGLAAGGLRRMQELERAIVQIRSPAWNDVTDTWERTAVDVALEEPLFMAGSLTSILPVELDLVQPSERTLKALATTRPFQGRNLKEWARSAARSDLSRIQQQIRIGMVQGESSSDIANRVFGARGAMAITRGQAEAVTRTVINGVSNAAQQEFLADNADLFDIEQIVATLDGRTSPVCRAEDGKQYPIGKGPIPPLHVNCRSLRVAVLDGEVVGERPFRAATEKQMLREYAESAGLGDVPKSRDALPKGHKGKFDAYARKRMRELTGQVPARTTYDEWLRRQNREFQDDVLGPARAQLFRDGMTLDRFVSRGGDELTLDEIRERNTQEWQSSSAKSNTGKVPANDVERAKLEAEAERRREIEAREEAERRRMLAEEEAERAEQERQRVLRELERQAFQRIADEQRRKTEAAEAKIAQHARSLRAEGVPIKFKQLSGNLMNRLRPKATAQLQSLELVDASALDVEAFGATIKADGYYDPNDTSLHLVTQVRSPGKAMADTNWSTGDVSTSPEEAFSRLLAHEYGHHVHLSGGDEVNQVVWDAYRQAAPNALTRSALGKVPKPGLAPEGAPSVYGTANHSEFWAESFTAYHFDRQWLRDNKPVAYTMVERVLELLNR